MVGNSEASRANEGSAAGMRRLALSEWLVVLPGAHIVFTVAYVWSYAAGFGANLRFMITASDIANAAVSAMPLVYSTVFGSLVVRIFPKQPSKPDSEIEPQSSRLIAGGVIVFSAVLTTAFLAAGVARAHRGEAFEPFYAFPLSLLTAGLLASLAAKRRGATAQVHTMVAVTTALVVFTIISGLTAGHEDRYASYMDPIRPRISCGHSQILRRIADRLLVVLPDGHKALVNAECDRAYNVPEPSWLIKTPAPVRGKISKH